MICKSLLPQCITHDACAFLCISTQWCKYLAILSSQLSCSVVKIIQSADKPDLLIRKNSLGQPSLQKHDSVLLFPAHFCSPCLSIQPTPCLILQELMLHVALLLIWSCMCMGWDGVTGSAGDTGSTSSGVQPLALHILYEQQLHGQAG